MSYDASSFLEYDIVYLKSDRELALHYLGSVAVVGKKFPVYHFRGRVETLTDWLTLDTVVCEFALHSLNTWIHCVTEFIFLGFTLCK